MMIMALEFLGGGWKYLTFVKVQNQLHRSLEYPLLDQFSFVYNPPSTCWMYMPLLIISEGFTPHPYLKSSSHDFCLQDSNN